MIAVYAIALWAAAGLLGVFGQRLLAAAGYAPTYQAGIYLAGGVAAAYLTIQLLYMTFIKALKPAKSPALYIAEALSQAGAVALLPYLLNFRIAWPEPVLEKIEPLLFLAAFAIIHTLFKIVSFFAALSAEPSRRISAIVWLAACGGCGAAALWLLGEWRNGVLASAPVAHGEPQSYQSGGVYALAQPLPEGSVFQCPVNPHAGQTLTLRWANLPTITDERGPLERVYVTVYLEGDRRERYAAAVRLPEAGWAEMRVPPEKIPEGVRSCAISWGSEKEPPWQRLSGFRPIVSAPRTALFSGPEFHRDRASEQGLNFIVLLIDGLAANSVTHLGYSRDTTPSLSRLAAVSLAFTRAYTPIPEAGGAVVSALTGESPLKHGVMGAHPPPLAPSVAALAEILRAEGYATAAFTEAEGDGNTALQYGSGVERGFEIFDPSYVEPSPGSPTDEGDWGEVPFAGGSAATLEKVRRYVERNADIKFFVFARLHELADLRMRPQYAPGFVGGEDTPSPRDIHDSAISYLDRHIGALVKHVRDYDTRKNTCIVIAGTYGIDFPAGPAGAASVALTEDSLRTPLVVFAPDLKKTPRNDLVSLEDLAPTILEMAGTRGLVSVTGRSFLAGASGQEPLSIWPAPLAISIRTEQWRFLWVESGAGLTPGVQLFDMRQRQERARRQDVAARNPRVVEYFQNKVQQSLAAYRGAPLRAAE